MEVKDSAGKPISNQTQETSKKEGYSTQAKVAMVVGAVVAVGVFWWCGGVDVAKNLLSKVFKAASNTDLTQDQIKKAEKVAKDAIIAGGAAGALSAKGAEKVAQMMAGPEKEALKLSKKCDIALAKVDKETLVYKEDDLDKLASSLKYEDLQKMPGPSISLHKVPTESGLVTIETSGYSNPFEALSKVGIQTFSVSDLEFAEKAVQEAKKGEYFDVEYYRPMILVLCEKDVVRYKPLKDKLQELEEANSMIGKIKNRLDSSGSAAIESAIGSVVGNLLTRGGDHLNQQIDETIPDPKNIKADQEKLDDQILKIIKENHCEHITDVKGFKKLAENTFKRHPHFLILHQALYDKCLEDIEMRANNRIKLRDS